MRSTVETLQFLGLAAAGVSGAGAVLVANDLFRTDDAPCTITADHTVKFKDPPANERLARALGTLPETSTVEAIPLRESSGVVRHVVHVLPFRRQDQDAEASAILAVTSATFKGGSVALVQNLFDLTPAEAALAQRIGLGQSVEDIAQSHGRSVHTLRTQLKSILAKTGCSRQAELAYILTSLVPPVT